MGARITKAERQRYIDECMNATGSNTVTWEIFSEWLKPQEDHPAWDRFFAKSDAEAAEEYRKASFRHFVSDLRIVVDVNIPSVVPQSRSVPAYTSTPSQASGYVRMDPDDVDMRHAELSRGLGVLKGWHERYAGLAVLHGVPIDAEIGATIARLETALTVAE